MSSGSQPMVDTIRSLPHWRIEIRPVVYEPNAIRDIDECLRIIERAKVRFRGWDYPHLPRDRAYLAFADRSICAWVDFAGHKEFWTFFQSAQFIHLFGLKEALASNWNSQLRIQYEGLVRDIDEVPGFVHIGNCLWTVTEVFEFAARLCEQAVYQDRMEVGIALKGIQGFALTTDPTRAWYNHYAASEAAIQGAWPLTVPDLVANRRERAVEATAWLFKRFGWLEPNLSALRDQQAELLTKER